ncbi:DUF2953 domain-containing protein [Clostridium sp. CM027]|uniref:DUF2953 domain-containing protein n=1 Tax=Clostridium sp. CM027 TaxID=2849865 RepID=UPI001C6E2E2A|nr:DUF2953 domain-containing protein [Clostridium sp. CM027]MBW9144162.1 DUF2953 domain-containing protein [Clostridium sp. CM027]UVE41195.1 DUF2953 domain-containing protein [Clostridium sp. CM027]
MFKCIIVFLLTIIIILFPIHLKITLKYSNKILGIYIYNKKLKVKKVLKNGNKNDLKGSLKENFFKSLILSDIKLITYKIKKLKFKPTLTLNTKLEYGFDDAALVAILFGLIHSTYSFLYLILTDFVKVKNIDLKVNPHFKKNDFVMEISSIIYVNLAKITYIAFIMLICLITIKHNKMNIKKYKGGNIHG